MKLPAAAAIALIGSAPDSLIGRDHDPRDAVPQLEPALQAGELGERGGDADPHLVAPPGVGDQPHHGHAVYAEDLRDLALRLAFDEIEPGGARARPIEVGLLPYYLRADSGG